VKKKRGLAIFLFLLPSILLFLLVFAWPVILMAGSSFTDWRLASTAKFIGLGNYIDATTDRTLIKAFTNTLIWVLLQSSVHVAIGVTFALILSRKPFFWKFARTVYMVPNIISAIAIGMLFLCIFNPKFGVVNETIRNIGFAGFEKNWFFDYTTAFFTVTLTWLPFAAVVTLLTLAEIAAIPESILEAASIDGASVFQTNLYIILPNLKNIIGTSAIVAATSMLKNFDLIMVTTNGAPGNLTLNLPLLVYQTAMLENNYGYANTIGMIITLMGIFFIIVLTRAFNLGKSEA
jgi:raffinose/stachyose/melibiose transport system permease protein